MQKLETFAQISTLVTAQLKRGVRTNCFLGEADYRRELAAGTLFYESWAGGLVFLCQRSTYARAVWYLTDSTLPLPCTLPTPTVMEIAQKPETSIDTSLDFWLRAGFTPRLHRLRLCRVAGDAGSLPDLPVRRCTTADHDAVLTLLSEIYHPYYSCLPQENELLNLLHQGAFWLADSPAGELMGLLHIGSEKGAAVVRHLAVYPQFRGKGVAAALLQAHFVCDAAPKSLVWTATDNLSAQRLYVRAGYQPDGWASVVLSNERN